MPIFSMFLLKQLVRVFFGEDVFLVAEMTFKLDFFFLAVFSFLGKDAVNFGFAKAYYSAFCSVIGAVTLIFNGKLVEKILFNSVKSYLKNVLIRKTFIKFC